MKNKRNSASRNLIRSGLNSKLFPPEMLLYWMARPRNPILACNDNLTNVFIEAMLSGEPVKFIYCGGSQPGAARSMKVSLVFQHEPEGRVYVSGYCLERAANRIFALDLIMVIHAWN